MKLVSCSQWIVLCLFAFSSQRALSREEVYRYDLPYMAVEYFVDDSVRPSKQDEREKQLKEAFVPDRIIDASRAAIEKMEPLILNLRSALFPSESGGMFKQLKRVCAEWKRGQLVHVVEWSVTFGTPDHLYPFTLGTIALADCEVLEPRIRLVDDFQASVDDRESLLKIKNLEFSVVIENRKVKSTKASDREDSDTASQALSRANSILREYGSATLAEERSEVVSLLMGFEFGVTRCRIRSEASNHEKLLFWSVKDGSFLVHQQTKMMDLE